MADQNIAKDRLLYMYNRLVEGKAIYKVEEMERHNCSNRSLQRDIEDLRNFFYKFRNYSAVVYKSYISI